MSYQAVLLLLIAATVHAGWNFFGKRQKATPVFFLMANTLGTLALLIPISLSPPAYSYITIDHLAPPIWGWIILTGFFQACYYLGLSGAYQSGDLSFAYPLLRSVPVVLVVLANFLLGRADQMTPGAVFGMFLVAIGAFFLPWKHFSDWNWRHWFTPVVGWALFAAINTVGYSLVDDHALRILRATTSSSFSVTLVYAFWEGLAASFWLSLFILIFTNGRAGLIGMTRSGFLQAALTGVGVYLAYTIVLIAMGFVTNISYVVAFRQTSILIGALLGIWVLHEPKYQPRLVGIGILFVGLVIVGLG